jgi:hypothetical protein
MVENPLWANLPIGSQSSMTVCIAAVCDDGKNVVVAADRMFTAPPPISMEFETSEKKIESLAIGCVAMSSGNSAYASEIIAGTRVGLAGAQQPLMSDVAERVKEAYVSVRMAKLREQILIPHMGPDFLRVEAVGKTLPEYLAPQGALYGQLVMLMTQFNLGSDFIVTGVDTGGARICVVGHPGTLAWLDKLGYASTGSGGIHATMRLALGAQTRSSSLTDTVYRVFDAKKASEVAPGVGPQTDMAIVSAGSINTLSESVLKTLLEIFNESEGKKPGSLDKLASELGNGNGNG